MQNNELRGLDILNGFSIILGCLNYDNLTRTISNDELMKEIKKQDREYLEKIISQNEEIIRLLKDR